MSAAAPSAPARSVHRDPEALARSQAAFTEHRFLTNGITWIQFKQNQSQEEKHKEKKTSLGELKRFVPDHTEEACSKSPPPTHPHSLQVPAEQCPCARPAPDPRGARWALVPEGRGEAPTNPRAQCGPQAPALAFTVSATPGAAGGGTSWTLRLNPGCSAPLLVARPWAVQASQLEDHQL